MIKNILIQEKTSNSYDPVYPSVNTSKILISASQITSGVLPVSRGGTGQSSLSNIAGIFPTTTHSIWDCYSTKTQYTENVIDTQWSYNKKTVTIYASKTKPGLNTSTGKYNALNILRLEEYEDYSFSPTENWYYVPSMDWNNGAPSYIYQYIGGSPNNSKKFYGESGLIKNIYEETIISLIDSYPNNGLKDDKFYIKIL